MNANAMLHADHSLRLANERMQELHRESAIARMASADRPSRNPIGRIAAAVSSIREAILVVDTDRAPKLPSLTDYPYRS